MHAAGCALRHPGCRAAGARPRSLANGRRMSTRGSTCVRGPGRLGPRAGRGPSFRRNGAALRDPIDGARLNFIPNRDWQPVPVKESEGGGENGLEAAPSFASAPFEVSQDACQGAAIISLHPPCPCLDCGAPLPRACGATPSSCSHLCEPAVHASDMLYNCDALASMAVSRVGCRGHCHRPVHLGRVLTLCPVLRSGRRRG